MKRIKIIDLFNMISQGKIPKRIKYDNEIFEYNVNRKDYITFDDNELVYNGFMEDYVILEMLNEEIEIIEEYEIEKIKTHLELILDKDIYYANEIGDKINEIIDRINNLDKN